MSTRDRHLETTLYKKHGSLTRVLHWVNLITIAMLTATGIAIWRYDAGAAKALHFAFAFALIAVAAVYVLTLVVSGKWRMFLPSRANVEDAAAVVRAELGAGAHEPALLKYNGAQRLAYGAVFLMAGAEVLTGCALYFRHQAPWFTRMLGGEDVVSGLHIAFMFGITAFALVHVVQVLRAGLPALLGMIGGVEPTKGRATFDGTALADPSCVRTVTQAEAADYSRARRTILPTASAVVAATAVLALTGSQISSILHPRHGVTRAAAPNTSVIGGASQADPRDADRDRENDRNRAEGRDREPD
jgi:thiosulfate reductase cytochrome b subunit